ncbi:MAG: glycosyltransferase family 2 protein [Verrucomicrobia bacterium]|nr:glycosyltransferase family 2 protein [Verrucomicrobiota bacterium]
MKFSIITPSFRNSGWLKLCIASVADQTGVEVEHLVQDAGSDDGTLDWLPGDPRVKTVVEKDHGMYDAINRGFLRATGEVLAWLNCDEQYLPGTLARVAEYFSQHPEVDVLFGDAVLLDARGEILSYRRALKPTLLHTRLVHLSTLSCATFVRHSVIERGFLLNTQYQTISDAVWVATLLRAKLKMAVLNKPLSAFTITGTNLGQTKIAFQESARWRAQMQVPGLLRFPVILMHRLRKFLAGAYARKDLTISVYTVHSPESRIHKTRLRVPSRWPGAT